MSLNGVPGYKRLWKKTYGLLLGLCMAVAINAQNTIGIPNIVNYSRQTYNAGSQNWEIAQDRNGIMYFANNSGLLSFDGASWRTYVLPNKTIVRSVAVAADGRIYVGGQADFGYFYPGAHGELLYTSLKNLVPSTGNDFTDVWDIVVWGEHVFFRSNKKMFDLVKGKLHVFKGTDWRFLGNTPSGVIAYEFQQGLVRYRHGGWEPALKAGSLPETVIISATVTIGRDSTLLVTSSDGLFILHNDSLSAFTTPDIRSLADMNIFHACAVGSDKIALVSNLAGCVIIDKKGRFIQRFTRQEGLQSNNIRAVMVDKDQNMWLGLNYGIDLIAYSNAIRNIFPDQAEKSSGYTSTIYKNQLYLGLATGLYKVDLQPGHEDLSYVNGDFSFVKNTTGQVWSLSEVNGHLIAGHNKGAYIIDGNQASTLDDKTGFWTFQLLHHRSRPMMIAGTYNGINFYNYDNGAITNPNIHAQFESARYVVIRKDSIWIMHPFRGLYKVYYNEQDMPVAKLWEDRNRILSANHNHLYRLAGKMVLTSDNGYFEYDTLAGDFVRSTWLESIFGNLLVNYITEDRYGNLWFCKDKMLGIVDRSAGKPRLLYMSEVDDKILSGGFEHINVIDSSNIFIAAEKGFFHLNYAQYTRNKHSLQVFIRLVKSMTSDSLIFGGHPIPAAAPVTPSVHYGGNSLHFEYAADVYGQEQNMYYSYFLEGFDKAWSDWIKKTEKDYTNLPAGNYVFKVKCRNTADNESVITQYAFTILPPWYQTWWAYVLYAAVFFGILYLFYKRQQRKYKRLQQIKLQEQQRRYDEEQKQLQFLHQLEIGKSEKQIIQLTNEKLQAEIGHKNSELASSAMNLVRKMEMLSRLKADLVQYKSNHESEKGSKEFQKIIRTIDKELDHDEEWEQFAIHFDNVHTNYLKKLKENYPDLTASELKLAAYLRLSLTTKEIAQLMNISIRGVETSRYRLRKKLNMNMEDNLFDFLISVTK
jgi:DNA-binding CsgD family transcriptional regulator